MTYVVAGLVTFGFTTVLTIAGVGAAFILIPVFLALGVDLHPAMATALLLNAIAMTFACLRFVPAGLVEFRTALPMLIVATILSPLGAYTSSFLPVALLKWLFVGFLLFAASMMLFYRAQPREVHPSCGKLTGYGVSVGGAAGYLGGLLGVGGGNFIVPALVWLGFDPKKASATTAFIVIFSSLSGFLGKASMGQLNVGLLAWTAAGSIAGALLGSWLMQKKLQSGQVKKTIGVILYAIAANMAWKLVVH
ncbi:MAG: sulfite exporter TauE/SafE family protein [Deltaproteobacteria bacterium]|nr:sulfite exporter TauE/SafE family protein [Deltaproteobacteria bacterium]